MLLLSIESPEDGTSHAAPMLGRACCTIRIIDLGGRETTPDVLRCYRKPPSMHECAMTLLRQND